MGLPGLTRALADKRYSGRLRALTRQQIAYPAVSSDTVTVGTPAGVGAATLTQTTGSLFTNPVIYPLYKSGAFANGVDTARYTQFGWSLVNRFNNGQPTPAGFSGGGYPYGVEFLHYGAAFEIRFNAEATAAIFQVFVDDQPVSTAGLSAATSAGTATVLPITFSGGAKLRRVRLEMSRSMSFGGIIIPRVGLVTSGGKRVTPQGVLFGDSYADGANGVGAMDTYAVRLGKYLNCDLWVNGQGGTGMYATGGGGTKAKYLDRVTGVASDSRLKPDFVILQGSINDANGNEGQVPTVAPALITAVRAQWPAAKVIVTGLMYPRGTLGSGMATANTNLRTAATAAGAADLFIDAQTEGWYSGGSVSSAPDGTGNSDLFMSSDSTHPTPADHDFKASLLARRITDYFASLG